MKKMMMKTLILIFVCFTIVTACSLCLDKAAKPSNVEIYSAEEHEKVQELLHTYPIENAVANGCFVMVHGDMRGDSKKTWNTFNSNIKNENNAAILIVQYTIEGDPILNYVSFVNGSFFSVKDISRDSWGGPVPYYSGSYKFLKMFEEEGQIKTVMLCNIDYKTWEEYENDTRILLDIDDYDNLEEYFEEYEKQSEANNKKTAYLFSTWDI
jgi:hypothetical protein